MIIQVYRRWFIVVAAFLALFLAPPLRAQGGPPMITDDPGSPGPGHWEINLGWEAERTGGTMLSSLPLLDANYGIGDRIEVTYEAPWAILKESDESVQSGMGDSLLGFKYRYFDAGDKGWQASFYPQVTFVTPGSNSDRRGLADAGTSVLLPFEFAKDCGDFSIDFDFGSVLSNEQAARGWMGGFLVGKQITKTWELDTEIHLNTDLQAGRSEWIFNTGTRIDFSEHLTLMVALGTDLANTLGAKTGLLSYIGFQLRL
jgi:outer membrane putative beta-barrel porin/alpha-amylase